MQIVQLLIEQNTKQQRQSHIDLCEECIERGGNSTNHKGVLAQYLNTDIPYGTKYLLCHACHNGKCSNPKHLYWGTPKENVEDATAAGNRYIPKVGHLHSEESKLKISNALKGRPSNNKNGKNGNGARGFRYTRKTKQQWVTNGTINKRIRLEDPIPENWYRGRVLGNGAIGSAGDFESQG